MPEVTMTDEQYRELLGSVQAARMEVAEVKGAVNTFSSRLTEETAARTTLGIKYDAHDVILRGDGIRTPGLAGQISDLSDKLETKVKTLNDRADQNAASIAALRHTIWFGVSAVAIPVVIDLVLRIIQIAYRTPTP